MEIGHSWGKIIKEKLMRNPKQALLIYGEKKRRKKGPTHVQEKKRKK